MDFSVLLVEDETTLREVTARALEEHRCDVRSVGDGEEARKLLGSLDIDLLLTDIRLPRCSGMELLEQCRELHPRAAVILITAYATVEQAVAALKQGAHQYLRKPFEMDELLHHVTQIRDRKRLQEELDALRGEVGARSERSELIGHSPAMHKVRQLVETVAPGTSNVLITGPSGTGKSLAARAIHRLGPRRSGPFVNVNCAAIPESLLESELFGHEPGSFTGALRRHEGYFERARSGTLLLDEIGDLPLTAQAKILQVIQEHSFHRVGGTAPIEVDFRLICASNQKLEDKLEESSFRLDLYYRLAVLEIRIPPLRERPEDLPLLADVFLRRFRAKLSKPIEGFSPEAWSLLRSHPFPGNVRELENVVERGVVLCPGVEILASHLPPSMTGARTAGSQETEPQPPAPLREAVRDFERSYIRRALTATEGNQTHAARSLGISRKHLWSKLRSLGVRAESGD